MQELANELLRLAIEAEYEIDGIEVTTCPIINGCTIKIGRFMQYITIKDGCIEYWHGKEIPLSDPDSLKKSILFGLKELKERIRFTKKLFHEARESKYFEVMQKAIDKYENFLYSDS